MASHPENNDCRRWAVNTVETGSQQCFLTCGIRFLCVYGVGGGVVERGGSGVWGVGEMRREIERSVERRVEDVVHAETQER